MREINTFGDDPYWDCLEDDDARERVDCNLECAECELGGGEMMYPTKLSQEKIDEIIRMKTEGVKGKEIAERLGIVPSTVTKYTGKHNIEAPAILKREVTGMPTLPVEDKSVVLAIQQALLDLERLIVGIKRKEKSLRATLAILQEK